MMKLHQLVIILFLSISTAAVSYTHLDVYKRQLYNVEEIKEMLDGKIDTLHFDEAWLPHATFHDFYGDYHAIGEGRPRCKESMVFSTQSTHKLLAGLSQASQILVQDAIENRLDRDVFNEALSLIHI